MVDFEPAMIKALKYELKKCSIYGCRFHLGQNWWRKIKELGLAKEYSKGTSVHGKWLHRVFGLSLVPHVMIEKVFMAYKKTLKNPTVKMNAFINYLHDQYVTPGAHYPPIMWAGIKVKCTNNGAEAFHRHFGDLFGYLKCKPGIWHFLRNMRKFNVLKSVKMNSNREERPKNSETESHIKCYKNRKINVTTLLKRLAMKNQPKINLMKKRKFI